MSDVNDAQLPASAAVPENDEIAARFAAQVAAIIGGGRGHQDMMMEETFSKVEESETDTGVSPFDTERTTVSAKPEKLPASAGVPENNEIAARFAAQVAAIIGGGRGHQDMMMEDTFSKVEESETDTGVSPFDTERTTVSAKPEKLPASAGVPENNEIAARFAAQVAAIIGGSRGHQDMMMEDTFSKVEEFATDTGVSPFDTERTTLSAKPEKLPASAGVPENNEIAARFAAQVAAIIGGGRGHQDMMMEDTFSKVEESATDTGMSPFDTERTTVSAKPEKLPASAGVPENNEIAARFAAQVAAIIGGGRGHQDMMMEDTFSKVEESETDTGVSPFDTERTTVSAKPEKLPASAGVPENNEIAARFAAQVAAIIGGGRGHQNMMMEDTFSKVEESATDTGVSPFDTERTTVSAKSEKLPASAGVPENNEIAARFAAQVAAVIGGGRGHQDMMMEDTFSKVEESATDTGVSPFDTERTTVSAKPEKGFQRAQFQEQPTSQAKYQVSQGSFYQPMVNQPTPAVYHQQAAVPMSQPARTLSAPGNPQACYQKRERPATLIIDHKTGRNINKDMPSAATVTPETSVATPGIGSRGESKRSSQQRDQARGAITHVSIQEDVKLHTAEQAWKPSYKDQAIDKPDALLKKVRGILNKLTPQNFKKLMQQINDLRIDTQERLVGTIYLIFERAIDGPRFIDEPNYVIAYANMCKCMSGAKVPREDKPDEFVTFRKILLNRCQKEFEKDKTDQLDLGGMQQEIDEAPEDKKKILEDEKVIAEMKAKRRTLGNIRFIGELFKLKMLTEAIIHSCLMKLIRSNDEENLECLCRLLTTIGKELDHEKAKQRMDQYFAQMQKIVDQKRTCSRVRFMLMDIIELRLCYWVPRRADNNPKTIKEVHKEAQREAQEKQLQSEQVFTHKKQNRGPRFQGHLPPQGEDGWHAVGKARPQSIYPRKMKLTKPVQVVENNIQLGPPKAGGGFMGAWGKGSSAGGFRPSSQESDHPPTPSKRYQVLSGQGGDSYSGNRGAGQGMGRGQRVRGRSMSDQRARHVARALQKHDREAALKAAKSLQSLLRQTPSGSRNQSRESRRNREMPPEKPAFSAAKELSPAEMEQKSNSLLDEYLHVNDLKVKQKKPGYVAPPTLAISTTFSGTDISLVFHHLIVEQNKDNEEILDWVFTNVPSSAQVNPDFIRTLMTTVCISALKERNDDTLTWELIEDKIVRRVKLLRRFLTKADLELQALVALQALMQRLGHPEGLLQQFFDVLYDEWVISEECFYTWEADHNSFKAAGKKQAQESVDKFYKWLREEEKQKIFPTKSELKPCQEMRSPDSKTGMSMERISTHLDRLIVQGGFQNEMIFSWIAGNVPNSQIKEPAFIRALMTSVCNSAIKCRGGGRNCKIEEAQIQQRSVLLHNYLGRKAELEVQALYALQGLVHKLKHPPGLLRQFFDILYDEDVISEDAFHQWEASQEPAEQAGKALAQQSVVQFFTWLREADEEES